MLVTLEFKGEKVNLVADEFIIKSGMITIVTDGESISYSICRYDKIFGKS